MGEKRNAYRILVGKPEETKPLGILRHRWKHNIKMDVIDICMYVCMYVCIRGGPKSGPCTTTFNDLYVIDIVGTIILKWMLERYDGVVWTRLTWLRIGASGRALVNTVMNFRVP
jgi:hypothetical protein